MTEQHIDIVVTDKGVKEAAASLKDLGTAAKGADASVKGMQASQSKAAMDAVKLATAEQRLAAATANTAKSVELSSAAWLINERDLQRAVVAEKQAEAAAVQVGTALTQQAASLAKLETEQTRAAAASRKLEAEWINEERALQDAIAAQARADASLEKLAQEQAKTALSTQKLGAEWISEEAALQRTIAAEAKANAELTKLEAEQSRAAVAARKLEAEWINEEAALQRAIRAQKEAEAALIGVETEANKAALSAQRLATEQQNTETAFNRAQSAALKLKAQEALLAAGQDKLNVALGKTGAASKGAAAGHKLQAYEMANLGYQVQDIAVSLAGGQNPFMVLLQQGSQIQQIYANKPGGIANVFGDIAGIIGKMINPVTILAAGLGAAAFAIGDFANRAANIQDAAKEFSATTDQVQILQQTLNKLSTGKLGFGDFKAQSEDLALKLADAVRNPQQQVARLFAANKVSLTDQQGKLKDITSLWRDSVGLIRNAGSEVDAIEIGKQLGLTEDFVKAIYRAKDGFDAVKQSVSETGVILDEQAIKKAADFEKAAHEAWVTFKTDAEGTLLDVGQSLFKFTQDGSKWLKDMWKDLNIPELPEWVKSGLPGSTSGLATGLPDPTPGTLDSVLSNIGLRFRPELSAIGDQGQPAQLARWANKQQGNLSFPGMPDNVGAGSAGSIVGTQVPLSLTPQSEATLDALAKVLVTGGTLDKAGAFAGTGGGIPNRGDVPVSGNQSGDRGPATIIPTDAPPKAPKAEKVDPLKIINAELDKQINLLGMLAPQREVQQKLDDYEIQLMRQKKPLSDTDKAGLKEKLTTLQAMAPVQQQLDSMYQSAIGPMQTYNATIAAGNKLLDAGIITTKQYNESAQSAWEETLKSTNTVASGIDLGFAQVWDSMQTSAEDTANFINKQFGNVEDFFVSFTTNQPIDWESMSKSIIGDLTRIITQLLIFKPLMESLGLGQAPGAIGGAGGGGFGGLLSGLLGGILGGGGGFGGATNGAGPAMSAISTMGQSVAGAAGSAGGIGSWLGSLGSLIGFADGAPNGFYPGSTNGRSGPDSQVAAFRVSPDERIKVETPAQARAADAAMGGTGAAPNVTVPVKVVNVTDPNEVYNAMDSDAGTKVVLNILRRNPGIVRQLASGQ